MTWWQGALVFFVGMLFGGFLVAIFSQPRIEEEPSELDLE